MATKLPGSVIAAIQDKIKANLAENAELSALLAENGEAAVPAKGTKGSGMSAEKRAELSAKMKAKHAANKAAKATTEQGGVPGEAAAPAAGIDLAPAQPAPVATPA